jgi:hypothetical protein
MDTIFCCFSQKRGTHQSTLKNESQIDVGRRHQVGGPFNVTFDATAASNVLSTHIKRQHALAAGNADAGGYDCTPEYIAVLCQLRVHDMQCVVCPLIASGITRADPLTCARAHLWDQNSNGMRCWYARLEVTQQLSQESATGCDISNKGRCDVLDEVECHDVHRPTHVQFIGDRTSPDIALVYNKSGIARVDPPIMLLSFTHTRIRLVATHAVKVTLRLGIVPTSLRFALLNRIRRGS